MSGTLRIAAILTGLVLALGLLGPVVFADDPENSWLNAFNNSQNRSIDADLHAGGQTQTQTSNPRNTDSGNSSAHNFGNDLDPKATNSASSGNVTVWGPKVVLVKRDNSQTANSSASGTINCGCSQSQSNISIGGTNSGSRTAIGGFVPIEQTAKGGSGGDSTAWNYTGAKQDADVRSNQSANGARGGTNTAGEGGDGKGGSNNATKTGGNGGNSSAEAEATKRGSSSGSAEADAKNKNNNQSGGSASGTSNPSANGTGGEGGDARGANGGRGGTNTSDIDVKNTARNSGDTTSTGGNGGNAKNYANNNEGGDAKVSGNQTANGGTVKDNEQNMRVGHTTGPAYNSDYTYLRADIDVKAYSGSVTANDNTASAPVTVSNSQSSYARNDVDQTQRLKLEAELNAKISGSNTGAHIQ